MLKQAAACTGAVVFLATSLANATPTANGGQAYVDECVSAGVPKPPTWNYENAWHNRNGTKWTNAGVLENEFIEADFVAEVFYYAPPEGLCIALPRSTFEAGNVVPTNINLLGLICQSKTTGKACFWDQANIDANQTLEAADFVGGADLAFSTGGTCTNCHRGENTFLIHPATALGMGIPNRFTSTWVDQLIPKGWPENKGPTTLFDGQPNSSCLGCHSEAARPLPVFGGRFPSVSNETSSYCSILRASFGRTMPFPIDPMNPPKEADHLPYQLLDAACKAAPQPESNPAQKMMSFDGAAPGSWSAQSANLSYTTAIKTEGATALSVNKSGWVQLDSVPFNTWFLPFVGTQMKLDIYVPGGQPQPSWLGAVQLYVSVPAANLNNAYVGQLELTAGGTGWKTATLTLPAAVRTALLAPHADARFTITTNTPQGAPPLVLDNLRFAGSLVPGAAPLDTGTMRYDFERSAGWLGVDGSAESALPSPERAFTGAMSLKVDIDGSYDARFFTRPAPSPTAGAIVSYRVYIPGDAPVTALQPYVMDGNWVWKDSWNPNLPKNTWVTVTVAVPAGAKLPLNELGMKVYFNAPYSGPIYVDSVQY